MAEVTNTRAKVQTNPSDTVGQFVYNGNTYRFVYPETGDHTYTMAVARGDVDWVPIDSDSKAYKTLESKAPQAVKNELTEPSLWERLVNKIIGKKEFGGNMNYTSYLQGGGPASQQAAMPSESQDQLIQLVKAAFVDRNEEALAAVQSLIEQNPNME